MGSSGATRTRDSDAVQRLAGDGVRGGGGALPHAEAIQRSFGGHDLGGVSAHVGGHAAAAADGMGAMAYARGNDVAFRGAPDLFTAAHEAAHVVQQRAGVRPSGGVGAAGDRHEQQADQVASLVVQGRSAEAVLGPVSRGGGASAAGAPVVQHRLVNPGVLRALGQSNEIPKDLSEQIGRESVSGMVHERMSVERVRTLTTIDQEQGLVNSAFGEDRRTKSEATNDKKQRTKAKKTKAKSKSMLKQLPEKVTDIETAKLTLNLLGHGEGVLAGMIEEVRDELMKKKSTSTEGGKQDGGSESEELATLELEAQRAVFEDLDSSLQSTRRSHTKQLEQAREVLSKPEDGREAFLDQKELEERAGQMDVEGSAKVSERMQTLDGEKVAPQTVGYITAVLDGTVQNGPASQYWRRLTSLAQARLRKAVEQYEHIWNVFGGHDVNAKARIVSDANSVLSLAASKLAKVERITIDACGVAKQAGAQGWTSHGEQHIFMVVDRLDGEPNATVVDTLCHEAMHLVRNDIKDDSGYLSSGGAAFCEASPDDKLLNADHYACVVRLADGDQVAGIPFRPVVKVESSQPPQSGSSSSSQAPPNVLAEKTKALEKERNLWSTRMYGRAEQAASTLARLAGQPQLTTADVACIRNLHVALDLPRKEDFLAGLATLSPQARTTYMSAIVPLAEQAARRFCMFSQEFRGEKLIDGAALQQLANTEAIVVAADLLKRQFQASKALRDKDKKLDAVKRIEYLRKAVLDKDVLVDA